MMIKNLTGNSCVMCPLRKLFVVKYVFQDKAFIILLKSGLIRIFFFFNLLFVGFET